MNYLVYKHTSPSGKSYIGITKNTKHRETNHKSPNSGCPAFSAAVQKYGWDSFTHEILLEGLTLDEANEAEQRLIAEHNTLSPNGYNLTSGGKVCSLSAETRAKMSSVRKNKPLTQRQLDVRRKAGEARSGIKLSEERKQHLRQKALERGSTLSEEGRARKRALMQNRKLPEHWRESIRMALNTDECKTKRSNAHTGMKWWNNGTISKRGKTCPGPGFVPGRL